MKARLGVIAVLLLSVGSALGWLVTPWSYADLFAKSDLVVIASPLTRPRDTNERVTWQDITPPVALVGVTTSFETLFVIKGPKLRRFDLHHYREAKPPKPDVVVEGGPGLITFEPPTKDKDGTPVSAKRYLLFLIREKDGRFAPVSGQRDPMDISVQEVSGVTVDD